MRRTRYIIIYSEKKNSFDRGGEGSIVRQPHAAFASVYGKLGDRGRGKKSYCGFVLNKSEFRP